MSRIARLYRGEPEVDFPRVWRVGAALSALLVVVSGVVLVARGLNLGIDFEGGTSWEFRGGLSVEETRDVLREFGEGNARIQVVGEDTLRVNAGITDPDEVPEVTEALAEASGLDPEEISSTVVGPSWGDEITAAAERALVVFLLVITLYISVRLEWKMAIGALVALLHDIVITVGVYGLFQFEVTPATVVAFLTILGYSLYDTIVVYDRVQENSARYMSSARLTYTEIMSLALNQVLMRSLNTTLTSLLPVISILLVGSVALGAAPLQEFGIALFVGLLAGAYSSIVVASPVVVILKEREPRWRQVRERVTAREGAVSLRERAEAAGMPGPRAAGQPSTPFSHPPRPRKGRGPGRRR